MKSNELETTAALKKLEDEAVERSQWAQAVVLKVVKEAIGTGYSPLLMFAVRIQDLWKDVLEVEGETRWALPGAMPPPGPVTKP